MMQAPDDGVGGGLDGGSTDIGSGSAVSNDQLAFRSTTSLRAAYDEAGQPITISIDAFLQGMFVLSREPLDQGQLDQDGNTNSNSTPGQTENVLTCYRRNRFQTFGDIFFSAWPRSISTKGVDSNGDTGGSDNSNGQTDDIEDTLTAQLSAVETRDWTQVVILAANSRDAAESAAAGGPPELEWTVAQCRQNQRKDSAPATLGPYPLEAPISWDRLQFRAATANNGRKRREIRQRFRVDISLYATRKRDGAKMCLATASSALLTVRGRSPKNFEARDDQPLTAMIDGRSPNLLRQRQQQQQQLLQPHLHQQPPSPPKHRHHSSQLDPLAQPQPMVFQEAPLPQPHPVNSNANNNSDIAGSGGFIYSPTMWDWIDLNATVLQGGLDGYNQGMQAMGDGQVFSMPSVWAPAAADASILAAASSYDESQSFAFAPNLLSQDQLQASSFLPQSHSQSQQPPPPPPPPPPPSFQSHRESGQTATSGYSSLAHPNSITDDTMMAQIYGSGSTPAPVPATSSAFVVPKGRLASAVNKSNKHHPDTAAPPVTGPSPNALSDSARTTTTVNSSEMGSTSTSTATGKNRYTYIPMGMAGWQPPAEPVYWAHPWIHMQGKKAVSLIYPPEIATKTTKQHFFQEVES